MRRLIELCGPAGVAAITCLLGGAAPASAAPNAHASLVSCTQGAQPGARTAVFEGTMTSLRRGDRLQMRFQLLQGLPRAPLVAVAAPGLGTWQSARAGVHRFQFRQRVDSLAAPARYRAAVTFRWLDRSGHQFAQVQRRSPVCEQRVAGPDLRVLYVGGEPNKPGLTTYVVGVRNTGGSPAPAFNVWLAINGAWLPFQGVPGLGPGQTLPVRFVAPTCAAGGSVTAAADPEARIAETTRQDNTLVVACPVGPPKPPPSRPGKRPHR